MLAAILAIVLANSPLNAYYTLLLDTPVEIRVSELEIAKPLLLWVNDGLMAIFFLLVGLELKREFIEGELSHLKNLTLPGIGAIGGMAVPAAIYILFNRHDPQALNGWAIPAATDIAFALGVLSLLGSRVPVSLKLFLASLAIFDDIGAIVIIALFYTSNISIGALLLAGLCMIVLFVLNRRGTVEMGIYICLGVVMWIALLKSGVHATLSGVILAIFIPIRSARYPGASPLKSLERDLQKTVAFFILPIFGFCNSGIDLSDIGFAQLLHPVPLGIALGLFIGKQLGVFLFCWLAIRCKIALLPAGVSWKTLYATSVLCGIGFTMSLFIGSLAFEETGVDRFVDERLGIMLGSLVSGVFGYLLLRASLREAEVETGTSETGNSKDITEVSS